jgi:hypothetical protein
LPPLTRFFGAMRKTLVKRHQDASFVDEVLPEYTQSVPRSKHTLRLGYKIQSVNAV